jgi:hypothetical protein
MTAGASFPGFQPVTCFDRMGKRAIIIAVLIVLASVTSADATCSGSGLAWSCTAGTTVAQVQTTVNGATDGAVISFAPGSYSWGTTIELSNGKGVTLQGAGAGSSIVTVTGGPIIAMNGTLNGNNTRLYRITGFTFQNAPADLILWFYGPGTLNKIRVDHNTFRNFDSDAIAIFFGEVSTDAKFFGVIDHNTFTGSVNFMSMKILGAGDPSNYASSVRGTGNNIFVEDNVYDFASNTSGSLGSGCIDAWNSSAVVFRYNSVRNCLVTSHGVVHSGGTVNFELYRNTLRSDSGSVAPDGYRLFHHQGSGELFVFQNNFTAVGTLNSSANAVTHYRSATPQTAGYSATLGRCDGTRPIDGNFSPSGTYAGYPCWNQPGRAPHGGAPIYGLLSPMYSWQNVNTSGGAKVPLTIENPWGATNPSVATHVAANRDYYDAVSASEQSSSTSPFNGTIGMGFGTLANRPAICTTNPLESGGGVAYYATDVGSQGTLYRCSSLNTWTVHYVPYAYPHPLTVGGQTPPNSPSGLIVQ